MLNAFFHEYNPIVFINYSRRFQNCHYEKVYSIFLLSSYLCISTMILPFEDDLESQIAYVLFILMLITIFINRTIGLNSNNFEDKLFHILMPWSTSSAFHFQIIIAWNRVILCTYAERPFTHFYNNSITAGIRRRDNDNDRVIERSISDVMMASENLVLVCLHT